MISTKNLYKSYNKIFVLTDVSINIEKGSVTYLVGPNASGKTTLIKLILGLVKPTKGEIIVNGVKLNGDYKYKEIIGYMPQAANFPDNLTVKEILNMLIELRNKKNELDYELIENFKLNNELNKQLKNLSGGTRQKINASIAFLFNPEILILDEPTAGLDLYASKLLKEKIIKENKKGKTIIFTSHILHDLNDLATNIIFLNYGKVIFSGKKEEIEETDLLTMGLTV